MSGFKNGEFYYTGIVRMNHNAQNRKQTISKAWQILDIKTFFKIQQKNSLKSFRFIVIFNFSSCIDGFIKNSGRKFKFECENFKKIISGLNNRSFPLPGFELPTLIKNYNPTLVALLESPMLDDPHLSQQHASLSGSNQGQRQDFEPT